MAVLSVRQVQEGALQIIRANLKGIRFAAIVKQIADPNPETPINTIQTTVAALADTHSDVVTKPERGLYVPVQQAEANLPEAAERNFYDSAAAFLRDVLDECSVAVTTGNMRGNGRWGNPDVIGVYKPLADQIVKFAPELVSAEIKIDPAATVTAFGQAMSYRLFSHRTYLFLPNNVGEDEKGRLGTLCHLNGIGLVYFELNAAAPAYSAELRAQRFNPDMFYVNDLAEKLRSFDRAKFQQLFG